MSSKKYGSRVLSELGKYRVSSGVTSAAVRSFLQSLDCPRSLAVWLMFSNGEHEQLVELGFDPRHYLETNSARDAYAATEFLSKFKSLSLDRDREAEAFKKFDEFELLCKQTNRRFKNLQADPLYRGRPVWLHHAVTRKIEDILGDFSAEELFLTCDWGPGASTLIKRREASSVNKFQLETGITRDLHALMPLDLLREVYPLWSEQLKLSGYPTLQPGNKVVTVPKSAKIDRVIAIEPGINLWFQKAIGEMISQRLLRCGIDLRFQSRNQKLARIGSKYNSLATIDLSSASDSVAREVIREVLPPRWYSLLDSCRSHFGTQGGKLLKWEKFSSMGNGFTFQLESLVFYAIAVCCCEHLKIARHRIRSSVSVYGDDIILPSPAFEMFAEAMTFYGFRINGEKSHYDSPFRESCGAHWHSGRDVKPIYLKDRLSSAPAVFRLANAVRRLAHRQMNYLACDARFRPTFDLLLSEVPKVLRLRIPETLGDGGFISNFDEAAPSRLKHGIEGYRVYHLVEVSKTYLDERMGYLLTHLWALSRRQDREICQGERRTMLEALGIYAPSKSTLEYNSVPMKMRLKYTVPKSIVQQWYDLGPWI